MRIAFRADAGKHIGLGHVMRCSRLADELKRRGQVPLFLCRAHEGHAIDLLEHRGHEVITLPVNTPHTASIDTWLAATQVDDARDTRDALSRVGAIDWLIIDHYAINSEWHEAVADSANHSLVIDDLANRHLQADILLNQNLGFEKADYAPWLRPTSAMLLGPRYALLSREYAQHHSENGYRQAIDAEPPALLVSLGGSDPTNLTDHLLDSLQPEFSSFRKIDVVISRHHPRRDAFIKKWNRYEPLKSTFNHRHSQPSSRLQTLPLEQEAVHHGNACAWESHPSSSYWQTTNEPSPRHSPNGASPSSLRIPGTHPTKCALNSRT